MQHKIDVKRLLCPMPVIRLSEQVAKSKIGDSIQIAATDPGVLLDIPAWCKIHGHRVIETKQSNSEIVLWVEVMA